MQAGAATAGFDLNVFGNCEAPLEMFPCGAHFCRRNDQYCERTPGEEFPPDYTCRELPAACIRGALPACDCMEEAPCSDDCEDLDGGGIVVTCEVGQPGCPDADADADGRCDDADLICNLDGVDVVCLSVPPNCPQGEVPESEAACWTERCVSWEACADAVAARDD